MIDRTTQPMSTFCWCVLMQCRTLSAWSFAGANGFSTKLLPVGSSSICTTQTGKSHLCHWYGIKLTKEVMNTICQQHFISCIMKGHGLENLMVTGRIQGRTARGRQRLEYLDSLCASWKDNVSPLEVISNVMRSINPRFIYLLTYLPNTAHQGFRGQSALSGIAWLPQSSMMAQHDQNETALNDFPNKTLNYNMITILTVIHQ